MKIKWIHWTWLLLTLFFLFFRLQNIRGTFTSEGVIMNDTDPYYRLHRIDTMLNENRFYPLHEDKLNYPIGLDVSWPLGLDLLIATPLKLYNATKRIEIESFSAVVIPFLSLPLLWFGGWLGTSFGGPLVGILLGLLITCSSTLIYQTGLGRVDHHFLEAMIPVMLLMFVRKFMQTKQRYLWISIVLILGLSPSFIGHGWIFGAFLIAGLIFSRQWNFTRDFSRIFFLAFLLSLIPLSFSDRFFKGSIAWSSFSWWSPFFYISISFFLEIIHSMTHPSFKFKNRFFALVTICLIATLSFIFLKNSSSIIQDNVYSSFHAVAMKQGTMATTQEVRSPFSLSLKRLSHSDTHLLLISSICFLFFFFQRRHYFLLGYALLPIVLSFFQIRFLNMGMPLMMLISILFLYEWLSKWKRSQTTRNLVLTIICILIIVPFRPYFGFTAIPNTHYFFWPIRTFSQFLNHDFVRRKEVKSNQSILAHWDYGHWLLYYTGLPVISSPFQGSSAMEVLDLFTSKGTKSIDTFIQKYPTRFLILEAGAQRSLNWIETAGKDKNIYFEKIGEVDGQDQFKTTPIFEDLFMYRFFFEMGLDLDNNHPQHWRLIYISPYASPVEKDIPALKVFEYVPGVTIHLHTKKQYAELYIQAEIKQLGEGFLYQQSTKGTHDFTWTVPYGTYDQASVGFDGKYVIRDENGKILHTISEITEKQVLAGDSLKIQF